MTENFQNLEKGKAMQVQEAHRVPIKMTTEKTTPRQIRIKMPHYKDKEDIKSSKGETIIYKGTQIRPAADFSTETLQARREWQEILQVMKSKGLQPRLPIKALN